MSASSMALPQPTPTQLARGIAGAVPAELSKSPLLGILGVVTGAGVVTLTSRMISLGVPDLKGHLGFSYDEGAWIGTAFDVGLMFIGPFTVYLGGLMGPRRILLAAATIFTLLCIFLPFIHSYSLLIVATCFGGTGVWNLLSADAHVCAAQHSSPVSSVHDCSLRLVRGFCCKYRAIALRLVPKSSFLGMDVLEFGGNHAADDVVHLLGHTEISSLQKNTARRQASRDFYMRARVLHWSWLRASKVKGSTGGTLEYSPRYSPAARSCCYALWYVVCAAPILWLICLTCGNGTRFCWALDFSSFAFF